MTISSIVSPPPMIDYGFRLVLAVAGGYAASVFCGSALAAWLPLSMLDATAAAIMLSYLLFTAFGVWAFAASSPARAALGLLLPAALCAGLVFLKQNGGV